MLVRLIIVLQTCFQFSYFLHELESAPSGWESTVSDPKSPQAHRYKKQCLMAPCQLSNHRYKKQCLMAPCQLSNHMIQETVPHSSLSAKQSYDLNGRGCQLVYFS